MSKFEVGDLIKGIDDERYNVTDTRMKKAKVIDVYGNDMKIKILEHDNENWKGHKLNVENNEKYFSLLEEDDSVENLSSILEGLLESLSIDKKDFASHIFISKYKENNSVVEAFEEVINEEKIEKNIKSNDYEKQISTYGTAITALLDFLSYKKLENDLNGVNFLLDKIQEYTEMLQDNLEED